MTENASLELMLANLHNHNESYQLVWNTFLSFIKGDLSQEPDIIIWRNVFAFWCMSVFDFLSTLFSVHYYGIRTGSLFY